MSGSPEKDKTVIPFTGQRTGPAQSASPGATAGEGISANFGGGIGGGGPMDPEIEERIRRSEAETETKIVRVEGKVDRILDAITSLRDAVNSQRDDLKESIGEVRSDVNLLKGDVQTAKDASLNLRLWIVGTAIAIAVSVWGVMAYGNQIAEMVTGAYQAGQAVEAPTKENE